MNIMRFLTPKSSVSYLDAASTVRNGFEKMTYHTLVFLKRIGAGAVNKLSALFHTLCGAVKNLFLPFGAGQNVFNAPILQCGGLFAEHPLTRAGRINYDLIEKRRQLRTQSIGSCRGYDRISDAHSLDIGHKRLNT